MKKKNLLGYTALELLTAVMVVGIFLIIAIPKFIRISDDARTATTVATAGALSAANAANYCIRKVNAKSGIPINNCTDVESAMQKKLADGYLIQSATVAADHSVSCTLTGPRLTSAVFTATGIN